MKFGSLSVIYSNLHLWESVLFMWLPDHHISAAEREVRWWQPAVSVMGPGEQWQWRGPTDGSMCLWQSWNRALVVAGGPSQNTPLICTSDLGRKGNGMWGFNFCLPTGKISRQLFSAQPQSFSLKMNNFLRKDRAKNVQFTSVECPPLWALSLLY